MLGALAMVASGMAAASSPAGAAFPGINGKIACSSNRTGNFEVFLFNPDATESGATNITNHPGNVTNITNLPGIEDSWPNWSPDGSQIVFHSRRDDPQGEEIYRMNRNGSNVVRLTFNNAPFDPMSRIQPAWDIFPAWSPDGSRIVWNSGRAAATDGFAEIYTMNASDGGNVVRITNNLASDQRCDWQPLCTIYGSGDIVGTAGNDIICGSEGDDRIAGLGGADIVYGFGGNDQLSGGDGADRMFGGIGNDSFVGGPGADFTSGGPGADRFSGETVDRIDVGAGPGDLCVLNGAAATCPPRLS